MSIHSISSLISYFNSVFELTFGLTAQKLSWNSWSISASDIAVARVHLLVTCTMSRSEKFSDEALARSPSPDDDITHIANDCRYWSIYSRTQPVAAAAIPGRPILSESSVSCSIHAVGYGLCEADAACWFHADRATHHVLRVVNDKMLIIHTSTRSESNWIPSTHVQSTVGPIHRVTVTVISSKRSKCSGWWKFSY